jgi:hypothetical protein
VQSVNTSVITVCTDLSSMTIFPNKLLLIVKCHYFSDVLQVVRLTQVMCFIFTHVFLSVQLRWTNTTETDPWQLSQLLKHKLVMCQHIFQQMSSQLLTDRSSLRQSYSIKVLDQQLTSVFQSHVSVLLPKLRLWSKLLVHLSLNSHNIVRSLPSLNLVLIWMLPLSNS